MVSNKGLDNGRSKEGPEQKTYRPPLPLVFGLHGEGNPTTIQNKNYQWSPVTTACEFDRFTPTDKKKGRKFELLNIEFFFSKWNLILIHWVMSVCPPELSKAFWWLLGNDINVLSEASSEHCLCYSIAKGGAAKPEPLSPKICSLVLGTEYQCKEMFPQGLRLACILHPAFSFSFLLFIEHVNKDGNVCSEWQCTAAMVQDCWLSNDIAVNTKKETSRETRKSSCTSRPGGTPTVSCLCRLFQLSLSSHKLGHLSWWNWRRCCSKNKYIWRAQMTLKIKVCQRPKEAGSRAKHVNKNQSQSINSTV